MRTLREFTECIAATTSTNRLLLSCSAALRAALQFGVLCAHGGSEGQWIRHHQHRGRGPHLRSCSRRPALLGFHEPCRARQRVQRSLAVQQLFGLDDRDTEAHPVVLLHDWKQQAEHTAREQLGRRQRTKDDGPNLLIAAMGNMPNALVSVDHVHRAVQEFLHREDPRFAVATEFRDNRTHVVLRARQPVDFSLTVPSENAGLWSEGVRSVVAHGRTVTLPMAGARFKGSKLLDRVAQETGGGTVTLAPKGQPSKVTMTVPVWKDASPLALVFTGEVNCGAKAIRFEGKALGGLTSWHWRFWMTNRMEKVASAPQ